MRNLKSNKGITLVALIITIIVLLILAVVAISEVNGDGIITKAKLARANYQEAQGEENTTLAGYQTTLDSIKGEGNGGGGNSDNEEEPSVPGATFKDGENLVTLTWEQLMLEENGTKYGYHADLINENSILYDGYGAFNSCTNLITITIPNNVTNIGMYTFADCSNLTSATLPNEITTIKMGTFSACSSLISATIPDSVTTIDYDAFQYCRNLTSVTIGSGVTNIKDNFWECSSLTNINVNEDNTNYSSIDGVLFNKGKTELIYYPYGKTSTSYTIPDNVTTIKSGSFYCRNNLTSITISNSVTSIEGSCFFGSRNLTSVTIGSGVTSIGNDAFAHCTSLTSITVGSNAVKSLVENSGYEGTVTVNTSIN